MEFVTILLFFMFWIFYFFATHHVSQSGIEPTPPALEDEVLTAGPPGKSLYIVFLILFPQKLLQNIESGSLCYTVGP